MCVFAFLTNIICDFLLEDFDEASLNQLYAEIFTDVRHENIFGLVDSFPSIRFYLAMPTTRTMPTWFARYRPTMIRSLVQVFTQAPLNISLLDDYSGEIEKDQVHYTLLSGMGYVQHLADEAVRLSQLPLIGNTLPSMAQAQNSALINGLEHRMTQVEDKVADQDARFSEETDNIQNEREHDRFIITNLPKLSKYDQAALVGQVSEFVSNLVPDFNSDDIIWVRSIRGSKANVYNVHCRNINIASVVKSSFASAIKSDDVPEFIGNVSISFCHALGTRVRLALLRAISRRQHDKDPTAICSVTAFTARPLLR